MICLQYCFFVNISLIVFDLDKTVITVIVIVFTRKTMTFGAKNYEFLPIKL